MDGFEQNEVHQNNFVACCEIGYLFIKMYNLLFFPLQGIILMAATNLPDILDPALTRPGRFDRHVSSFEALFVFSFSFLLL